MVAQHTRSVALWTLDPLSIPDIAKVARVESPEKIVPSERQIASTASEAIPCRGSVFGQLLAEIW